MEKAVEYINYHLSELERERLIIQGKEAAFLK